MAKLKNIVNLQTTPKYLDYSKTLSEYLGMVRQYDVLNATEQKKLIKKAQEGDNIAKEQLILSNQRFIYAIAKRYGRNDNLMDIVQEANLGLIEAIGKFNTEFDVNFISYAVYYVILHINHYLNNKDKVVNKSSYSRTARNINKIKNKYYSTNGIYPNEETIREILLNEYNIKINDDSDCYDVTIFSTESPLNSENFTVADSTIYNDNTSSVNAYNKEEEIEHYRDMIRKILNKLSDRERTIISMLYGIGYDAPYSVNDVAEALNLTVERIRQIKNETINKLHENYRATLFD